MKFTTLTKEEFDTFNEQNETRNFFQTSKMYERYQKEKKESYLVGVKENDKVIASSLILISKKRFNLKVANIYKGYIMDFNNKKILEFFTNELKKFLKEKKCILLYIDPYLISEERDSDNNVIPNGINNLNVKKQLLDLKFKYIGEYEQVKWTYVLNINNRSEDEIFKSFKSNHRNLINKAINKYNVKIRKLSYEELPTFKSITLDASKRQGFVDKSLEYYQNMYNVFKDEVIYLVSEINKKDIIPNITKEIDEVKEKLNKTNNNNRKKVYQEELNILEEELKSVNELKDGNIPISASMFILYKDEITYLFSGSLSEYQKYNGSYLMQWHIIKYAIENNYKKYNFYGIKPDLKDGVYKFKRGFNGNVEELLGTFALPLNIIGNLILKLK